MNESKQVKDQFPVRFGPGSPMLDRRISRLLEMSGTPDLPVKVVLALNERGFVGPGEVTVTVYSDRTFDISLGTTASGVVEFGIEMAGSRGILKPRETITAHRFGEALVQSGKFGYGSRELYTKKARFLAFLKKLFRRQ